MSQCQVLPFEHYRKIIRSIAFKAQQRAHAAGARSVSIEDIEGDLMETWVKARNGYDPQHGVEFATYFTRAAWRNLNRWLQDQIDQHNIAPHSLDKPVGAEEDMDLHELHADETPSAEVQLLRNEAFTRVISRLSPIAQTFVRLLESPPPELYRQLDALRARAELGRAQGYISPAPRQITASMIFKLMGLSSPERSKVYAEINRATAHINQR